MSSNKESNTPPLDSDLSPSGNDHHGHDDTFLLWQPQQQQQQQQQQNPNPFSLENQNHNLDEAFSRLSLIPQNQNLNLGGQASNNGYPFAPNSYLSDVGLVQQQQEPITNNTNNNYNDIVLLQQQQNLIVPRLSEFGYVSSPSSSGTVPSIQLTPLNRYEELNRLRASLVAAVYEREYQRLLSTSQLSRNNEFLVFRGKPYGDHRDSGFMLNHEANLLFNNNHYRKSRYNNNVLGRRHYYRHHQQQQPLMSNPRRSVYELRGYILALAKDQCGCRVLQDTMEALRTNEEVSIVFEELIDHVVELMTHHYGNYVFQKLVVVCSVDQITHIVFMVTRNVSQLLNFCLDNHGTRCVQRLLECVTSQEQQYLIMSALSPNAIVLSKNTNGFHVIELCVKIFKKEETMCMMDLIANNCYEVATDQSGCCVVQLCIDNAVNETKEKLTAEIIVNAPNLSEDCFGNYVVQHLLSKHNPIVIESIIRKLEGSFFNLSCNKYGSNVVEKLIHVAGEQHSKRIISELLNHPDVSKLFVDAFGNYVISSAASVLSKGPLRKTLKQLVKLNLPRMLSNEYGKKLHARLKGTKPSTSHAYRI